MSDLRLVLFVPEFLKVPAHKLKLETGPVTGLAYFTFDGRTLAVAEPDEPAANWPLSVGEGAHEKDRTR